MEPERLNAHSGSTELHYKEAEVLGVIVSIGDSIRNYGKDIQGSQDQRTNGTDKAAETTGTEAITKMEVEKEMNGIDHAVIGLNAEQQDIKADIQSKHTISLPLLSVSVLSQSAPLSELLKKTNDPNHTPLHSLSQQPSMHSLKSLYSIHSLRSNSSSTRKDGVLVGTPVREGHANYMLMYDMLTGIRISVSRCNARPSRQLIEEDYTAAHKIAFDITGDELTPKSKYDFKFKDYAPWVFRSIRDCFSLTGKYVLSELGSPGKSGSFFYFSQDYRFIIKTIHHSEHLFLRKMVKQYLKHVEHYPDTLISRIFGLHRVKLPGNRKIHFVVMGNVFPPNKDIHEIYDLKGSTKGRVHPKSTPVTPQTIFKDQDWLTLDKHLALSPSKQAQLLSQLQVDVNFLSSQHIMDYSLLVGVHDARIGNRGFDTRLKLRLFTLARDSMKAVFASGEGVVSSVGVGGDAELEERRHVVFYRDSGGFASSNTQGNEGNYIYYLGIIDIFTEFGPRKFGESIVKRVFEGRGASCVDSTRYADRFLKFCKRSLRDGED